MTVLIADRHLCFPIRAQVRKRSILPNLCETPGQLMRQHSGQRHQLLSLICGVAEHHALVTGTDLRRLTGVSRFQRIVDTLRNVRRLPVKAEDDLRGVRMEAIFRTVISDSADRAADHILRINMGTRGDLSGDDHGVVLCNSFDGDMCRGVFFQIGVQYGVGNQVADLVGMPLRDGFRSKNIIAHFAFSFFAKIKWIFSNACRPSDRSLK